MVNLTQSKVFLKLPKVCAQMFSHGIFSEHELFASSVCLKIVFLASWLFENIRGCRGFLFHHTSKYTQSARVNKSMALGLVSESH